MPDRCFAHFAASTKNQPATARKPPSDLETTHLGQGSEVGVGQRPEGRRTCGTQVPVREVRLAVISRVWRVSSIIGCALYLRGAAKEGEGRSTLKRRSSRRRHKNIAVASESPIDPLDTDQVGTYHNNKRKINFLGAERKKKHDTHPHIYQSTVSRQNRAHGLAPTRTQAT